MFSKNNSEMAEKNKTEGAAFLAENAGKEGIITTDSGLQYEIITASEGDKPAASNQVTVHYKGTTLDGTEFDSSYSRNAPATFPLNRVIAGWTEGVQLMSVGSKYRFFIPSELAYGAQGAGGAIGPNATLIFEVELLSIQ
jgi:FKBP-type peptidyl-prolyl cis-trans isomerase